MIPYSQAHLVIGASYLLMAAAFWLFAGRHQRPAAAGLWCLATGLQGVASMACAPIALLFATGTVAWETIYVAAALGGLMGGFLAVRAICGRRPDVFRAAVLAWGVAVIVFAIWRGASTSGDHATYAMLILFAVVSLATARECWHAGRGLRSRAATGLAVFAVLQALLAIGLVGEVQEGRARIFGEAQSVMSMAEMMVIIMFRLAMHGLFAALLARQFPRVPRLAPQDLVATQAGR